MVNSNEVFEVIKPGLQTTVQDLGRTGFQRHGIVVSGAMDSYALIMANFLVGNVKNAAGLEITLTGPKLYVKKSCIIAITGADMSPMINREPVPMWTNIRVEKDSIIEFGSLKSGCRAYLAVNGGIDVPVVMGSRSTYLKAKIGGYEGRALKSGDILSTGEDYVVSPSKLKNRRRLSYELIPTYTKEIQLRVMKGPQWDMFKKESQEQFFSSNFLVTNQSDRMGYRLTGTTLELKSAKEHITDPIPLGSIQVPSNGEPIILLADRQTTGGYPKIATIISVDISKVAQAKPGDIIHFTPIEIEESHKLLREENRVIELLKFLYLK